jgi:ABC-type Mn2+/Zn2+ transport system ATPase subunit
MVLQPRESLQMGGDNTELVITVENLKHTYDGKYFALSDLNLSIGKGEVFGLLGKNGAGKRRSSRCSLL